MTVNTTSITSGPYLGNGSTTEFSYDFRVENKNQLIVYETDDEGSQDPLTVDVDYTVNDVGVDGGGTITRIAGALPAGYEWYIRSNYLYTQDTAFSSQGGFFPEVHEAAIDKVIFLLQQVLDISNRSIRYPDSAAGFIDATLPDPVADKVLAWNGDASGLVNGPSEGDFQTYSSNAAASAAAALVSENAAAASVLEVQDQKIVWRGAYDAGEPYGVNEGISYEGASYIVISPVTGVAPPNGTYYDILALRGAAGAGTGDMLAANNLSDVANASTAKSNLGLANVNNTSDASKPVSTLQQTALNLKANLASPALTGTPTAPTATVSDNSTKIATTAFVRALVGGVTSTAYSITTGGLITWAHGLGSKPFSVSIFGKCTTAEEGYSIGDEAEFSLVNNSSSGVSRINGVTVDETNINIRLSNSSDVFVIGHKSTGNLVGVSNGSWDLYIRASL